MPDVTELSELLNELVGAPVPSTFRALLVVHIFAGMTCVLTGAVAMLSRKGRGRHPSFGEVYYWGLGVVFITATGMAAMSWDHSAYLFFLGCLAFGSASMGYLARKRRWPGWLSMHLVGMGASYIVMLTAFYVDNGPKLPLWQQLPPIAFWVGPTLIGLPLLIRALRGHGRFAADMRATAHAAAGALSG